MPASRAELYERRARRDRLTATVGTVFELCKVPLNRQLLATYLMSSTKKGYSAHQIHRTLGVTYKTAWFMAHRIGEGMRDGASEPMSGQVTVIDADETYMGGKERNKHANKRQAASQGGASQETVVSLVERRGRARSFHFATSRPRRFTRFL